MTHFGGHFGCILPSFSQTRKRCFDCAGAVGLHVRPPRMTQFFGLFVASPSDSVPRPHPAPLFHAFFRFLFQNGARKDTQGVSLERGFRTFWGSCAPLGATMAPGPRPRAPQTPPNLDFWTFQVHFGMMFVPLGPFLEDPRPGGGDAAGNWI